MKSDKRIASVGDNCVDIYTSGGLYVGGNAVNLAVAVRRSGVNCSYVGMVGDDANGREIAKVLGEEDIDNSHLSVRPGETGWTKIKLENNDRIPIGEDIGIQRGLLRNTILFTIRLLQIGPAHMGETFQIIKS